MPALLTHRHFILRKIKTLIFLFFTVFYPSAHSAGNFTFTKITENQYKITGSITSSDIFLQPDNTSEKKPLYVQAVIPNNRLFSYRGGDEYCKESKDESTAVINRYLSSGIIVSDAYSTIMLKDWELKISCRYSSVNGFLGGSWSTSFASSNPPPPSPPKCSIQVPQSIEFSNLRPGSNPSANKTSDVTLICDKAASGDIEILDTRYGALTISDASVNVAFGNDEQTYSFRNSTQQSTTLRVTVKDAGNTSGVKTGSVVLRATWD